MMIKNKKAAMEMSMGTIVTIVLLMTVLVLGLVLVRSIFSAGTKSISSIDDQVTAEINDLFSANDEELVVALGSSNSAKVEQGTEGFGFGFGYSPNNPGELNEERCWYSISANDAGQYCTEFKTKGEVEEWVISGINHVEFDKITSGKGFSAVLLDIPESTPICTQRYKLRVECSDGTFSSTWFDIKVVKSGIF